MSDQKKAIFEEINFWTVILLIVSFPFGYDFSYYTLNLWVLSFIIEKIIHFRKTKNHFLEKKSNMLLFIPSILYFTFFFISIIVRPNLGENIKQIESQLSFIAFPIIFILANEFYLKRKDILLKVFVFAVFLASVYSLFIAFSNSLKIENGEIIFRSIIGDKSFNRGDNIFESVTQGGNYFFGNYISPLLHTTYYAMYLNFGILFIISLWNKSNTSTILKFIFVFLIIMFSAIIFMLGSKGGIIALIISSSLFFLHHLFYKKKLYTKLIGILLLLTIPFLFLQSPRMKILFNKLKSEQLKGNNNLPAESTGLRLKIWETSIDIIKENYLFGVGPGNDKKVISSKLSSSHKKNKKAYDAHNQYFTAIIEIGLVGLMLFLLLLFYPAVKSIQTKNYMLFYFILIIVINGLFETIYGLAQGIVVINFFYGLLIIDLPIVIKKNYKNETTFTC